MGSDNVSEPKPKPIKMSVHGIQSSFTTVSKPVAGAEFRPLWDLIIFGHGQLLIRDTRERYNPKLRHLSLGHGGLLGSTPSTVATTTSTSMMRAASVLAWMRTLRI